MEEVLKPDEAEAAIEALLFTMGEAIDKIKKELKACDKLYEE